MRTDARRFALVSALAATAACSLTVDLSGLSEPQAADAARAPDASRDGSVDAAKDVASDVTPPPCKAAIVIDTPLTNTLGTWTPKSRLDAPGYPKIATFFGSSAAVLFPFVDTTPVPKDAGPDADAAADAGFTVAPEYKDAIAGIWQISPLPLRSFDVDFEIQVRCTSATSCGDGAAFAWLDTTNPVVLTNTHYGGVQGMPAAVGGAALFLDNFQNNDPGESSDPPTPALEVVQLDATKAVGKYPWVVTSKGTNFQGAWRKVSLSLRDGSLTVSYEGALTLSAKVVPVARGLVGFTGGTGGYTDAVGVRNVKASFYDCVP